MTKDYFKRVVATDIISKAMLVAGAKDERTQKAYAEDLARQITEYCYCNGLDYQGLENVVLDSVVK